MDETEQKLGRWTSLFGRPTLFSEDARRAVEVRSLIHLYGADGMPEFQYVQIAFDPIPGWETPLWATDGDWVYLRRPQGIWKTRLPKEHLGRVGVIGQRRDGASKVYGGIQIGSDFANRPAWHLLGQELSPEDMDTLYGLPVEGWEAGPLLSKLIAGPGNRVAVVAGDAFSEPLRSCLVKGRHVFAEGADGRRVRFDIENGKDFEQHARNGNLWLRFGDGATSWMEPLEHPVATAQ